MGWFLISVLVPVTAPLALLMLYWVAPVSTGTRVQLINLIKDGQLCWPALGFCASGLYELAEARCPMQRDVSNWFQAGLTSVLVVACVLAIQSVCHPTPTPLPSGKRWYQHFSMLLGSMVLLILASTGFTLIHFNTIE